MSKKQKKDIWKPFGLSQKEHREFKSEITQSLLDLDFSLRCYYLAMQEDLSLSEQDKLKFMKKALQEALIETGCNLPEKAVTLNFSN